MRQVLFLLIVLLSIEILNAQKKDTIDARKHSVYLDLVKSFKDSFEDTPLIINVQSKFRVDGIYYGTMGRTDFTYELGKDMIIVKVLNEKLSEVVVETPIYFKYDDFEDPYIDSTANALLWYEIGDGDPVGPGPVSVTGVLEHKE